MHETGDLGGAIADLDVLYQTRIQAERFESSEEYERHRGVYVVTADLMRRLPERAILMHPLPRLEEIDPLVDADRGRPTSVRRATVVGFGWRCSTGRWGTDVADATRQGRDPRPRGPPPRLATDRA